MSNETFNIAAYLDRINYKGKVDVSYETLYNLHVAHTLTIPFENLDVFYRKPILLDKESLFKKIVIDKRGGYCFEMNALFAFILEEIGFKVTNLLARGTRDGVNYGTKTHQVLMVEVEDKRYLADVGYGRDGLTAPLLIEEDIEQKQFNNTYKLTKNEKYGYIFQDKSETGYRPMYAFTLEECVPMDYVMSNHFTSTFPSSGFLATKMITMPTKEGRISLTDLHFKTVANGITTEVKLTNDLEFYEVLKTNFGLDLDLICSTWREG